MAKTKNKSTSGQLQVTMKTCVRKFLDPVYLNKLVFDPNHVAPVCWILLLGEFFLNVFIIERVRYTEIDWTAYMQEVGGFLNGTFDYNELRGDTGPCVYPAGFLYVYSALYFLTNEGSNVKLAQYVFLMVYMTQAYITYEIYKKTCKVPAYALVLNFLTSYRIHSIYVLRLFNDPVAVLLFYMSLNLFLSGKWTTGSVMYSLAVSVKMNILLYAPCLLLAYVVNLSYVKTAYNLMVCAVVQLILGAPFLLTNPWSYLKASFDLGRVFEHRWTVNYRFLERELFESKPFHLGLLVVHVSLLLMFFSPMKRYLVSYVTLRTSITEMKTRSETNDATAVSEKYAARKKSKDQKIDEAGEPLTTEQRRFLDSFEKQVKKYTVEPRKHRPARLPQDEAKYEINFGKIAQLMVLPFFVTNLIGVACARSLHYQFYSWYFHSLPYLVFCTPYKKPIVFLLLGVLEFCWNVYPSTELSSALLHIVHIVMLVGVYKTMKL